MECRAIGIDNRVVLWGWASQLEEGNDTLYCSKETVAAFLGDISVSTVQRRTKELLAQGWLIPTGNKKQWSTGWTPVYQVNVPMIVGILAAQPVKLTDLSNCKGGQIDRQGSRFRFDGLSSSPSTSCGGFYSQSDGLTQRPPSLSIKTEKRVVDGGEERTENLEPKTVEPKPEPSPEPTAKAMVKGKGKSCSSCGVSLERDVNHLLECTVANSKSVDEPLGKKVWDEFDEWQYPTDTQAEEARIRHTERKREIESMLADARTRATAKDSHAQPPVPQTPLSPCCFCGKEPRRTSNSDYCLCCWDLRQSTGVTPKPLDANSASI
jgi:hypothetical protein